MMCSDDVFVFFFIFLFCFVSLFLLWFLDIFTALGLTYVEPYLRSTDNNFDNMNIEALKNRLLKNHSTDSSQDVLRSPKGRFNQLSLSQDSQDRKSLEPPLIASSLISISNSVASIGSSDSESKRLSSIPDLDSLSSHTPSSPFHFASHPTSSSFISSSTLSSSSSSSCSSSISSLAFSLSKS